MKVSQQTKLAIATAIIIAIIVYGSLYPFRWRSFAAGESAVAHLLSTWRTLSGRGDLLANVLLYMPYGFFAAMALPPRVNAGARFLIVSLGGLLLCTTIELTQFHFLGRTSTMSDVYTNTAGSILGALGGLVLGKQFRWPFLRDLAVQPFPAMLLFAWLGYRFYPYVPTIDMHKYWHAIQPLLSVPDIEVFDLFRHTVIWLFLCCLLERIYGVLRYKTAFLAFLALDIVAKTFVIEGALKWSDLIGSFLGFMAWSALRGVPRRMAIMTVALIALVLATRLQPFAFSAEPHSFGWIPFLSMMQGSLGVNIQQFLEKFFLYGAALWLLTEMQWRLRTATLFVSAMLLSASVVQIFMPGRSAELTDAVLAIAIAVIYKLVPDQRPAGPAPRFVVRGGRVVQSTAG